jgi:outer membrane receptor protein involved in Fe transport
MSFAGSVRRCRFSSKRILAGLLCGSAAGTLLAAAMPAYAQQAAADTGLEEIVVTATRRAERLQDVPIAVQALSAETLQELNVENFDDLIKTLPGVTKSGGGPSQSEIYVRGLALGGFGKLQGSGVTTPFPNVAVYIDDESAQVPGRNLDIDAVDLERVEVLEGPQGTLFGSGAEAGVVRYITHKPDLDKTEAILDAGVAGTEHGDMSANGDATINVPLVDNTAALRLVIYDDRRGGYINNVPGTFVRQSTDIGIHYGGYTNNIPGPPNARNSANNTGLVGSAINPVTYEGFRLSGLWKFDNDWDLLLSESVQDMDAEGVFYETPQGVNGKPLPDLSVQLFNPSYDKDNFENTSLTLDGRIGDLSLVYNGSYLIRDTKQQQDYTNYARGVYADYYQCLSPGEAAKIGAQSGCYSPSAVWRENEHDTHLTQELRVKTPDDWRLRAIGGLFYEEFTVNATTDYEYLTAPGFTQIAPKAGSVANNPGIRDSNDSFLNDVTRGYTQKAAYASLDYDILPNRELTITAAGRYYDFENTEQGSDSGSFGCFDAGPAPCATGNGAVVNGTSTYTGFTGRFNLTWKIDPDALVYYTWSEGFRPGGFNRGIVDVHGLTFFKYAPDTLTNNEIGFKTQWLDHHITLNGAIYQEAWDNVQTEVFNPGYYGILTFATNGPNYTVYGGEMELTARVTDNLTVFASGELNTSRQDTAPSLVGDNGVTNAALPIPYAPVGSTLAQSPTFKGSLRARYEFEVGPYTPFFQAGITGATATHSGIGAPQTGALAVYNTNFQEQGYLTGDLSAGVSKGPWMITAYCDNCSNTRVQEFVSEAQLVRGVFVSRPMTAGLKIRYTFGGDEAPAPEVQPPAPPPPVAPPPPAPPKVEAQREFQVFFDFDKSDITEAAAKVIQAAADVVKAGGAAHITVTGHTDTVGSAVYNQGLSERRAAAVKMKLAMDGVPDGEITAIGVGKTGLLVATADGVREPQNRRAVIDIQ